MTNSGDANIEGEATVHGTVAGHNSGTITSYYGPVTIHSAPPVPSTDTPPPQRLVWNVPHLRNPNFTGRDTVLEHLQTVLQSAQPATLTQAIHGLGGVGKTQLAVEYAYRYRADYDVVWWVRAEEPAILAADYTALARRLSLPEHGATEQAVVVEAVRRWLDQHDTWLLILDNVTDPTDLTLYLPRMATGHVLITSRNPNWRGRAHPVSVNVLARKAAVQFLLQRTGQPDQAAAAALAEALGDLPLVLEQAGAYIEAVGISLAEYRDLFTTYRTMLLDEAESTPTNYPVSVPKTWELAIQQVQHVAPLAVQLLQLCAFLAPEDIPFDMLRAGGEGLPGELGTLATQPLLLNRAVAALRCYSLVDVRTDALVVHRMVQAVTRDRLASEQPRWARAAVNVVNAVFPADADDAGTWPTCERFLSHAITTSGYAERLGVAAATTVHLLNRMTDYWWSRAAYDGAQRTAQRALAIAEQVLGPEHPDTALSLNNLAGVLRAQGEYATAQALRKRALAICEQVLGPEHPDTAWSLNNLAVVLQDQGDYTGARPLLERALAICEQVLGPEHPDTAWSLSNLAGVLQDQGDYTGARPLLERALRIREQVLGPAHPRTALSLNKLAGLLWTQGDHAGARPLRERALAINEQVLGPEHPDTAWSLNKLAMVLQAQGDDAGARPLLERALAIDEQVLGPEHPDTAQSLNNLAGVLQAQGDDAGARLLYARALAIYEQVLGAAHPWTRTARNNLASLDAQSRN